MPRATKGQGKRKGSEPTSTPPRKTGRGRGRGRRDPPVVQSPGHIDDPVEISEAQPLPHMPSLTELRDSITTSVTSVLSNIVKETVNQQLAALFAQQQPTENNSPHRRLGDFSLQPIATATSQVNTSGPGLRPDPEQTGIQDSQASSGPESGLRPDSGPLAEVIEDAIRKIRAGAEESRSGLRPDLVHSAPPYASQGSPVTNINSLPVVPSIEANQFTGGIGSLAPLSAPLPLDYAVSSQTKNAIWVRFFVGPNSQGANGYFSQGGQSRQQRIVSGTWGQEIAQINRRLAISLRNIFSSIHAEIPRKSGGSPQIRRERKANCD